MKLFYAIVIALMVLISACAQQPQKVQPQPTQPAPAPETAEPVVEETEAEAEVAEEVVEEAPSTTEVRILGDGAFDPDALTINAGDSVTWINTDEKEAVIIIFKDGSTYTDSQKFKPGEQFEHEFTEAGSYQYWRNIALLGDGATITVE